jgi:hypothetical protein
MYILKVAGREWLYTGEKALRRARKVAQLLMRRWGVKRAEISPYCMIGDTLVLRR